jgi:hypothetical protein
MKQGKKCASLTKVAQKNTQDLFDSYEEREAEIVKYTENAQKEATDIIAKANNDGKLLLDEAVSNCAKMEEEKRDWEKEKESISRTYHFDDSEIDLNIGGQNFTTTLTTLTRFPDTMIGAMFSGRHDLKKNRAGAFFIDRDGMHFRQILNFLRSPETYKLNMEANLKEELKDEAIFYGLGDLMFPFTPAQPKCISSVEGYSLQITQDIEGMWFMTSEQYRIPLTPVCYCQTCKLGWNDVMYKVTFRNFNTGREIRPNQLRCSVIKPCPACRGVI